MSGWCYLASGVWCFIQVWKFWEKLETWAAAVGEGPASLEQAVGWPLAVAGEAGRQVYLRESEVPHKIEVSVGKFQ